MTGRESRPQLGEAGAAQDLADGRSTAIESTSLIGATVEKQLDATLWRLVIGEVSLHDLTPALRGWYAVGFGHGQDSMRPHLEQAESDRDRLYELANHGKELPDVRLRRMRAASEEYWQELIAGGAE